MSWLQKHLNELKHLWQMYAVQKVIIYFESEACNNHAIEEWQNKKNSPHYASEYFERISVGIANVSCICVMDLQLFFT